MNVFNLPERTQFNRVIPKNAFDKYTNTAQKKMLTEDVERIRWANKLAPETINLAGSEVEEIQVFEIELRDNDRVEKIMDIIDKSIPYTIIFTILFKNNILISTAKKHPHPTNPNSTVIDWRFTSEWIPKGEFKYILDLKDSLDHVFSDVCNQLSLFSHPTDIDDLVGFQLQRDRLLKAIKRTEQSLQRSKQFNIKVELNQELTQLRQQLSTLNSKRSPPNKQ